MNVLWCFPLYLLETHSKNCARETVSKVSHGACVLLGDYFSLLKKAEF
jgi:hypothetical protein